MPNHKNIKKPTDKQTFYINDPSEVRNWFNTLECTEDQLRLVVTIMGEFSETMKAFSGRKHHKFKMSFTP